MRKISMFMIATVFLLLSSIHAQTTLNPGDLVIVTANADGTDNFDFIPLVDIQAGTIIKFTDNAWTPADTLRTNEGTVTWTASADVTKGTVVSYTGATAGDWVKTSGFDIAASGDNILVYQGTEASPSFIYGIGWAKANNWIWTGNNDSDIPDALSVANKTIVQLANFDDNQYNGSTSGTAAQLLAMVAYAPYWVGNDVTAYTAYPTAFTITATATCTAPYALTATGITASSANLGWSTFGTEVLWNIEYGVTGFTLGTGTTVTGVTNPYTLNGLTQNTVYQYYVQADCSGSTSTMAGPFSFTTPYSCPKPTLPTVTNITATSADLGWTNGGTETAWIVYYKTAAATDFTEVSVVTNNPFTIAGLASNTDYIFKVKANCSVSDTSFVSVTKTFSTLQVPASIPYTEGFETWPNNWTVVNGTQVNKWAVGTVVANTGTQSAYVSNDNGTTNAYTLTSTSTVHMYRDITFPAGVNPFNLKFNWKGRGEGTTTKYDYLRVFLVPITTTPVSGTELTGQLGTYNLQPTWQTVNLTLANATYANQTWRLVVSWKNDVSGGTQPPIAIDDIAITELSCVPPTALTATSITATGANLGWTAGGTETLWNVEYGVTGFVQGAGTTVTGVTNPYTVGGLTQNTTYQFYVQSDCGGSGTSTWAGPFSFTTPYSCPKPTLPTVTNITTTSADLGWTNGGTETAWIVYYKTVAATDYTEVTGVTTNPYTLNGLSAATSYIFKVKANCSVSDTSFVSATKTFTTPCNAEVAPTLVQDFATFTGSAPQPVCWSEATGTLAATSTLTTGNSEWLASTGFANSGTNVGVKTNLYSSGNEWLISQPIDLGATAGLYRVSYKYAVTSYNGTASQSTLGTHKVNVVVSTDGGATWSNTNSIKQYTGAASYSNTGVTETINLTGYSGIVKIAFVVTTTATTPDIDFHIDDFKVEAIPSCVSPTALTATSITATGATLGWTAGGTETLWNVEYGVTGFVQGAGTAVTGVANPYTLTGLTQNTTYQFYVQSDCGGSGTSTWSGPFSFTTPYSCPKPTVPTVTNITATTADLGWTNGGTETAWIVYYKTAAATDYTEVTGVTTNPYTLGGLTPATSYIFKVKANCSVSDTSFTSATQTFTTLCNAVTTYPHNEPFTNYLPSTCWTEGDAGDLTAGPTTISSTASSWAADGFLNSGSTGAIKINIDAATDNDWIISPEFTIPAAPIFRLKYSVGATQWNATTAPTTPWESDDYVQVLVSTTYPANWTVLKTFNDLNTPSNLGQIDMLDLSAYAGQTIRIAFRGVEGATNGGADIDFFVDDFTVEAVPTCEAPTALTATAITSTDATLGWTAGGTETLWNVEYGVTGFTQGTGTIANGVTNPYAISGLTPNTTYQFYVQADCAANGTSTWTGPFSFTTACGAVTSINENFDGVTAPALPSCWSSYVSPSYTYQTAGTYATSPYNAPNCVSLYNSGATLTTDAPMLISPVLSNLNAGTNQIRFYAKGTSIIIGTMSDPSNSSTFTAFQTVTLSSTSVWNEYSVSFASYAGTDQYIAFKHPMASTYSYVYLDNISWETIPTCTKPTALTASSITGYDAIIGWTRGTTETAWNVQYGPAGFTLGTGTVISGIADTTYSLADLSGSTTYSFYVQADCGLANGQSSWAGPYTFSTLCVDVNAFSESFTNVTAPALPICWAKVGTGGSVYTQTSSSNTAPNTLYMYTSTATSQAVVSMPKVTNAGANTHWLRFNMRANSSIGGIIEIGYLTNPVDSSSFVPVTTRTASTLTYKEYIVNLGTAPGSNNTLAFRHTGSPAYSLLIDDVKWEPVPACLWPTALTATAIHGTGATLGWTAGGTETAWTVEYGPTGFTQGTGTIANTTTNSYVVTGLTNVTAYQFYVQANCGGSDGSSVWTGPYSFTTTVACPAPTALGANIGTTTTTLQWTPGGIETTWNLEWGPTGFTQGTGTTVIPTTNSYLLTGLTPQTTYQYYVQSACGSTWAGPFSFTTTCIPVSTIPWVESFESGYNDATTVSGCWTQSSVTGTGTWMANSTATTYNRTARTGSFNATLIYSNEDWLFYGFSLTGGTSYSFEMFARQDKSVPSYASIKVAYGSSPTIAAMTNIIKDSTAIINGDYQLINGYFTPATSGDYYIGIRGKISSTPWYISIDDIKLDLAPNCLPPTALNVPSKTSTTATLAWTAGGTETAWNVEYGVTGFAQGTGTTSVAATNSASVTGLTANTSYQFYVQANCGGANGVSPWAGPFSFYTGYCTPAPSYVDGLGITNVTFSTVNNTTTDEVGNYGDYTSMVGDIQQSANVPVSITYSTGYTYDTKIWIDWNNDLDFDDAGEEVYVGTSLSNNPTTLVASFTVPATAPLGQHRMRIGGQDTGPATPCYSGSYGSFEDYTVNVIPGAVCNTPTALVATGVAETTANLGWTSTAGNFNVRYRNVGGTTWTTATATTNSLALTGLTASTNYEFQVQAVCSATPGDTSDWATAATFTTLTPSACAIPTALTATGITLTSANLGWTSAATSFNVRYRIVGATTWTEATASTNSYALTSLAQNTAYEFQVQAVCSATPGDTSNWASTQFNTLFPPCGTPTALAASSVTQTAANLGWTSGAANFNVRYRIVGATTWTDATASTTTLALTSLTANTQYEFQVQAVCSTTPGDTSAWATTATFTTLIPVCATPTALTATGITETAANLGWTSTATNFNVRYRTVGATTWTAATANTTTLALTSLTANTQYEFQVQAVCSATPGDTSAWATAATFTTLTPATCNAPSALVVSAINSAGATLNWTAGGTETAWNIRYKKVADATYTNVNNTTTKPYVLTTLQSNTAYVWNVQAVCSSTLTSAWSADNTFNTTVGIDNNTLTNLSVFSYDNQINVINSGNILVKSVVIYNMIGQEVGTYAINSTDNILVNTNLVIGTYMVKVVTADKVGTYKLFIK